MNLHKNLFFIMTLAAGTQSIINAIPSPAYAWTICNKTNVPLVVKYDSVSGLIMPGVKTTDLEKTIQSGDKEGLFYVLHSVTVQGQEYTVDWTGSVAGPLILNIFLDENGTPRAEHCGKILNLVTCNGTEKHR